MTISNVGKDSNGLPVVWTVWFDNTGKESKGYYPAATLRADDGSIHVA
jgi:hypothetical protein